jgi:MFS family permease
MTQTTELRGIVPERGSRNRSGGPLLTVLLLGQFMGVLDVSIVNVALPTMRADLHASGAGLQLIVAGYIISYAVLLITGARLGALLGHRRMFHLGLAVFTVMSLACGLAPTTGALIAFRFLQGTGAALLAPQVISLIQRNFTGAARARALSMSSAAIAGGVVVGQAAGGVLVSAGLFGTGWRTVFLVNVPIGIALLLAGPRVLPREEGMPGLRNPRAQLDLPGLLALSAAVLLFVVPLVMGHELGWPAWGWVSLAASAAFLTVFVAVQRRAAMAGGRPLISPRVLRAPLLVPACIALMFGPGSWAAFLFTTTLHLQGELGMSPLESGIAFVPCVAAFALVGLTWQRLPARLHRPAIPAGLAFASAGYLCVGPLAGGGAAYEALTAVIGFGLGVMPIIMTTALHQVAPGDAADASGLMLTLTQLAQVIGIATAGTLFLGLAASSGSTRHAEYGTGWALAAVTLIGAVCALLVARDGARARPPGPAARRHARG